MKTANWKNKFINSLIMQSVHIKLNQKLKSPDNFELTIDIKVKSDRNQIVNTLDAIEGINSVAMVSYDGDYAS